MKVKINKVLIWWLTTLNTLCLFHMLASHTRRIAQVPVYHNRVWAWDKLWPPAGIFPLCINRNPRPLSQEFSGRNWLLWKKTQELSPSLPLSVTISSPFHIHRLKQRCSFSKNRGFDLYSLSVFSNLHGEASKDSVSNSVFRNGGKTTHLWIPASFFVFGNFMFS